MIIKVLVILAPGCVSAQNNHSPFQHTLYAIISQDSIGSDSLLLRLDNSQERAYLMHYDMFIRQMIDGRWPVDYDRKVEGIIDTLENNAPGDKRSFAFLSELYIQKGIMEFSIDHQRTALFSFFKAYRLWRKSKSEYPQLTENIKLNGIFNLLMSNMPQPYKKMAAWIGFSGDDTIGFNALKTNYYANSHKLGSKQEAILYLAFAYLKFEAEGEKVKDFILNMSFEELLPVTRFTVARCAFKIRSPILAEDWLLNGVKGNFLPLVYLRGKYKVLINDATAENDLLDFLKNNLSDMFMADAYRYYSWQLFLQGDTSNYLLAQKKIGGLHSFPSWEDQQAKNESMRDGIPNQKLLRSRCLFDAGLYQASVDSLLTVDPKSMDIISQQVEFQYRLGRCYHLLKQTTTAIFHYSEAVKLGDDDTRYYAPYAALYNAELHMEQNPVTAAFYLNEAKRLNNGEYKEDIQRKIELLSIQLEAYQ